MDERDQALKARRWNVVGKQFETGRRQQRHTGDRAPERELARNAGSHQALRALYWSYPIATTRAVTAITAMDLTDTEPPQAFPSWNLAQGRSHYQ